MAIYDTFQPIQPFDAMSMLTQPQGRPQASLPPLTPQEQASLLDQIASGSLSGLGYIGGSLNKAFGGRAIRGLLGGRPEELASIIPFSDTLGITDAKNEVTGAELLGGNKDTSLFSPEGIGGLGLEIATDPSTWFGGAIMKGLGKGAQMAGKGLTKLPKVGGIFEAAGGAAKNLYTKTIPPLVEAAAMGRTTEVGQKIGRRVTAETDLAVADAMEKAMGFAKGVKATGVSPDDLRYTMEGLAHQDPAVNALVNPVAQHLKDIQLDAAAKGLPAESLGVQDALTPAGNRQRLQYAPRQATPKEGETFGQWFAKKTPKPEELHGREDYLQRMYTPKLNELSKADFTLFPDVKAATNEIAEKYLGANAQMQADIATLQASVANGNMADLGKLQDAEAYFISLREQAEVLAKKKLAGTLPEFMNHPVKDYFGRIVTHLTNMRKADAIYDNLAEIAGSHADGVPILKALKDVGFETGSHVEMLQRLQTMGKAANIVDASALTIPADVAKDLANFFKASGTEGLEQAKKIWDSFTNLNKAAQTILWPANHARNQMTAVFQNIVHEAYNPHVSGPMAYVQPWLDAHAWKNGKAIEGLENTVPMFKGMTNAQANEELSKQILKFDVQKNAAKLHNVDAGSLMQRADQQLEAFLPKSDGRGFMTSLTDAGWADKEAWKNPLGVHGVIGNTSDIFPPAKAGRQFASALDDVNRVSTYIAKLQQGLDPIEAMRASVKAHYNFGNLTNFEKEYMRRIIPFYGWMRQNVPAVLTELLEKPGGRMAQGIRIASELGGNDQGFTPDFLGSGVAAKVGKEDPLGMQTFLSSTGLPFEDLGNLTSPAGYLGGLNPLLKGPLELATNRQFFTGRDLTGTVPHTGSYAGDELLSATPLGRAASTGRMLLDDRGDALTKAANLLTGVRTSSVDMNNARRQAIQQAAEQMLAGQEGVGHFSRLSVRPEALGLLSPQELAIYRLYQQSQRR